MPTPIIGRRDLLDWLMLLPTRVKNRVYAIYAVDLGFGMSNVFTSMIEFNEMYRFINSLTQDFFIYDDRMRTFLDNIAPLYEQYNMNYLLERERRKGKKNFDRMMRRMIKDN
jgi:hypothetical protein